MSRTRETVKFKYHACNRVEFEGPLDMRTFALAATAVALAACSQPAPQNETPAPEAAAPVTIEAPSGEYKIDKNHASVQVRALHFGLSNYTLRFTDFDATLNFDAANPAASTLTATVNPASVETDYTGAGDFDGELQNSDWLDAATHPTATFTSTGIELTGANTGRVTGDLTIKGVTHPLTLDVTFNNGYARHPMGSPVSNLGFSARGTIKRSDYGLNVLLPNGGPSTGVADEVELVIEAEFTRPIEDAAAATP